MYSDPNEALSYWYSLYLESVLDSHGTACH